MNNRNIIIRKANKVDIPKLIKFGKCLHNVEKQFEPLLTFNNDEATKSYNNELANPKALLLVAENPIAGESVGYLYAHYGPVDYFKNKIQECEIEVVYIRPNYRGKRIAYLLIKECLAWAKENGVVRFKTSIFYGNLASRKLFESNNFKPYHITYILKP